MIHRPQRDTGTASVLVVAAIVVLSSVALAVGRFGRRLHDEARAQTAADAAALAGALGGRARAAELATANHAVLVSFIELDAGVRVMVSVHDAVAFAQASSE